MILRIGLTGGIGSGKSTVAKIFEVLGIPVYYADAEARRIMNTDIELKKNISRLFGEESYTEGILKRTYIASLVFNNSQKLDLLNSLVHPATKKDSESWMKKLGTSGEKEIPYAIHEAALIFEAGVDKQLDYVIGISAPLSLRISRTIKRNDITKDEVEKRMNQQMDEEQKLQRCDFVIINDEQQLVIPQVLSIHNKLLALNKN